MRKRIAGIAALQLMCSIHAQGEPQVEAIQAPTHKVGDTWVWSTRLSPVDECTQGIGPDAKTTQVVSEATAEGYVANFSGPRAGQSYRRKYDAALAHEVTVKGQRFKSDVLHFPIRQGNKWETKLGGGNVVTSLTCEANGLERIKIGKQELITAVIECKGDWENLSSGNSGLAFYSYYYSSEIGNIAKRIVRTRWKGKICSDFEEELESFKR